MTRDFFKKLKVNRILPVFFFIIVLALPFVNCSHSSDNSGPTITAKGIFIPLSAVPYSIDSSNYTVKNFKLVTGSDVVYFQFISACTSKCPVVVASMAYTGIDWSDDSLDQAWSLKDPSGSGVLTADINGPGYIANSGDVIPYYHSSINEAVGFGGVFLNSGISTVLIYNRFYLGRQLDSYVKDFAQVVDQLSELDTVDASKVALLGASLGGFVALHASRKSVIKPVAIVGITPLLDMPSEHTAMSTASQRITANSNLLSSAQHFFNSYLRRMTDVAKDQFTSDKIAQENTGSKIMIIHDTWDTVVPISQWQHFGSVRPIDSFIFQHASPIDFNTFSVDHGQASEGFNNKSVLPIYMSYILNRLKAPNEVKTIYYYYTEFTSALVQAKAAQARGQDIRWMNGLLSDLCTDSISMKDLSGTLGPLSGAAFAGGVLANIWNFPTTVNQGCNYLATNSNLFN